MGCGSLPACRGTPAAAEATDRLFAQSPLSNLQAKPVEERRDKKQKKLRSRLSGVAGLDLASFARSSCIRAEASIATLLPLLLANPREALHANKRNAAQPEREQEEWPKRSREFRSSSRLSSTVVGARLPRAPARASSALTGAGGWGFARLVV